ncbi:hypothetical protein Goklo_008412, partial [Gossypium klotzschianum]|nr:hypothetical protein [Gossypium klotzschianum]
RKLTVQERLWFSYSAQKSDYILYTHNCLFLFLVFSFVLLPWALVEFYWFDAVDRLQPRVKISFRELFKCYKDVLHQFIFVVVPLTIVSFPVL